MTIACIAVDWGTSNRRAWALDGAGRVLEARSDELGLVAVNEAGSDFAGSFSALAQGWLTGAPVIMSGMVGSRAGWREAPYLEIPAALTDLALHLVPVTGIAGTEIRIAPGMSKRGMSKSGMSKGGTAQPDVMRGEECQLLGAGLVHGLDDGMFLLPGTHAKWARVAGGRLTDFRTYVTGELFGLLSRHGSLGEVIGGDALDETAFRRGLDRGRDMESGALSHQLFGVRSLSLFGDLTPADAGSYLSGLLIGAEMRDALGWVRQQSAVASVTAIGSAALLRNYALAAEHFHIALDRLESEAILPKALFTLAEKAGLLKVTHR